MICADREPRKIERKEGERDRSVDWYLYPHTDHSRKGEAIAYDAATGERLWAVDSVENFKAPTDVFVLKDFPARKDIKGVGMSDWDGYANPEKPV